jgi:hypothetical protein
MIDPTSQPQVQIEADMLNISNETNIAEPVPANQTMRIATEVPVHENDPDLVEQARMERILRLTEKLEGMYCPCTGFAYNSLAGDRNIFVSHL